MRRALPTMVWSGTVFFAAGAMIVVGDFGDAHPITLAGALLVVLSAIIGIGFGVSVLATGRPRAFVHLRHSSHPGRRGSRRKART